MGEKIIVIGFDMETDLGSWTLNDRGIEEGTPEILRVLNHGGVKATFLFTGREAQDHPSVVKSVLSNGHEVGCHTMYHETIGKPVFDMPGANFVLESEVKGRLELATKTVEKVAGTRPVSFRAPRLFGSTAMINALEDLGYLVDSSFPSYFYGRNFLPYRPSREDWSKEGESHILELPVFYDLDAHGDDEKNRSRDQWPVLRMEGPERFSSLCLRMMDKARNKNGHSMLCLYLHPWEFVEMPKHIVTDEATITFKPFLHHNCGAFTIQALDAFLGYMKDKGVNFMTMRAFAAAWRGDS